MTGQRYDWEKTKKRFEAWWHGEAMDRVLIQVYSRVLREGSASPKAENIESRYLDHEYRIREFLWEMEHTCYAGDAYPYMNTSLGPGTLSLYLGAKPEFKEYTVWYKPVVDDISRAAPPIFCEENVYWQSTLRLCGEAVKKADGNWLVAFPDLIENLDTVASLVGSKELLAALIDYPEKVHEFQRAVLSLYLEYHRRIYEIIQDDGNSCFSHFSVYGKGRVAKLQCDFSAMISPKMFEEFVVPYLSEQCRKLDHTVYHWDGPGALCHEEQILGIPELQAIQWTPGAGKHGTGERVWWNMYRRVLKAGKSLLLLGVTPVQAKELVEEFGPEGLNLSCSVPTREEADELVRQASTWKKR